jgi:hypothetical protein
VGFSLFSQRSGFLDFGGHPFGETEGWSRFFSFHPCDGRYGMDPWVEWDELCFSRKSHNLEETHFIR